MERTFYTRSKGLFICAMHGELQSLNGETKRIGEKHVQFGPDGVESDFGRFSTKDPELITFLEERERTVGDVFGPEKYNKLIIPAEMRNEMLERELVDKNRLIETLRAQGKGPKN